MKNFIKAFRLTIVMCVCVSRHQLCACAMGVRQGSTSTCYSLLLLGSRIYFILHRHCCAHTDALPVSPFVTEQHK